MVLETTCGKRYDKLLEIIQKRMRILKQTFQLLIEMLYARFVSNLCQKKPKRAWAPSRST